MRQVARPAARHAAFLAAAAPTAGITAASPSAPSKHVHHAVAPPPLSPPPPLATHRSPAPAPAKIAPLTPELMDSMDEAAKRRYAASFNQHQVIINPHLLPQPLGDATIIVLMVHNRPEYLKAVLRSLKSVQGIENALLVISLDYLSPEVDSAARSVTFCAVRPLKPNIAEIP
jgi:hypothetical protein